MGYATILQRGMLALVGVGIVVPLAVLGGFAAQQADVRIVAIVVGLVLCLFLVHNRDAALWLAISGSLVTVGVVQLYAPPLQLVRWAVGLIAVVLGALAVLNHLLSVQSTPAGRASQMHLLLSLVLFLTYVTVVGAVNADGLDVFAFGAKGYLQMWGLFFALTYLDSRNWVIEAFPKTLIGIAFLQVPFALHQYFFLVPARTGMGGGVVAEDVVAGTFGASLTGGGANAAVSLFLIVVWCILMGLYKRGSLSIRSTMVASVVLLIPMVLNANRIALLYIAIAYVMLFWREILRRPSRALIASAGFACIFGAILWGNLSLVSKSHQYESVYDLVETAIFQNTDPDERHGEFELNRLGALLFWFSEHRDLSELELWVGYGLGQSREAQQEFVPIQTLASKSYRGMGIGLTAVPAMLWELGVLGLGLVALVFVSAYRTATRLSKEYRDDPLQGATLQAIRIGVVIFGISLFHKNFFVFHIPYQAMLITMLGYLSYWQRKSVGRVGA